jgi:hypothetical protein
LAERARGLLEHRPKNSVGRAADDGLIAWPRQSSDLQSPSDP